ncbi:DedA family protein [Oerskovia enterophila]|uniref:Inner membrane protein YghB n=1 Tax=Oerskovia enterophila TaxID=43678 RepID=A0A163R292_9CELL|nr:inner membrane protein YghB [Oerskovia enterophila]
MPFSILPADLVHAAAASEPDLGGVAGWAVSLMETLGVFGAGLAIALENLFPPLPSEVILPLAGFTASRGSFNVFAAIVATTIGSLVGAIALYYVGVLVGRERTRKIIGWLPLVKLKDVDRTEAWFHKHGSMAVFFGRMIPIFRSLISLPAGVDRMPLPKFVVLTTAGSLIWNSIFVGAGYALGESWHLVEEYAGVLQKIVIAAVAVAVLVFVVLRVSRAVFGGAPPAHARGLAPDAPDDDAPVPEPGAVRRTKTPTTTLALPKGVFERARAGAGRGTDG